MTACEWPGISIPGISDLHPPGRLVEGTHQRVRRESHVAGGALGDHDSRVVAQDKLAFLPGHLLGSRNDSRLWLNPVARFDFTKCCEHDATTKRAESSSQGSSRKT